MAFLLQLPPWPHKVDGGVLLLVAALFLASVLAHRYWRATIRLEDEGEARELDARRALERYREAFRGLPAPAAFADRATGLVMEATPGWAGQDLPAPGEPVFRDDPALEAAWRAIPGPGPDHRPADPGPLTLRGRAFTATCLGGASLGVVLLVPREG
ncbi:hypothetical protein [Mesoterricola silvestris]|uniref:Uncharacterized protein n=1 Tax=Mesoterricola silvestris TaxID=2927979 RepID=A0AA48GFE6_9BACT|nr:hypothetical protein [Mesoterricola silvestris]BDU71621.1 hypothetical protein METEAL_07950 [Mesoterricola silvestris]